MYPNTLNFGLKAVVLGALEVQVVLNAKHSWVPELPRSTLPSPSLKVSLN